MNYFEFKVRYDKVDERGVMRSVTETYIAVAYSFSEAEARAIAEMRPYISGDFSVSGIRIRKFSETFLSGTGSKYYNAKLYFLSLDEKSGAEKRTAANMLVQADTVKEAVDLLEYNMNKTITDYTLVSVSETAIMDIFNV